jgi:hypothetical protein
MAGIKQAYEGHRGLVRAGILVVVAIVAAIVGIQVVANGVQDNVLTIASGGVCIVALLRLWSAIGAPV